MMCCVECFKDTQIRQAIIKNGAIGDCDFCSHKNVAVFDTSIPNSDIFNAIVRLVEIYSVSDMQGAKPLKVALRDDWDIFNVGAAKIQALVTDFCGSIMNISSDKFTKKVIIERLLDDAFLEKFGVVRGRSWKQFTESIKYESRFYSKLVNTDMLGLFFSSLVKFYRFDESNAFFRARISHNSRGYNPDNMGVPPKVKRSSGRVNPEGIGVLYLSSDEDTALSEVRANTSDFVSIGTFKLVKDIRIVNLSALSEASPFDILYDNVQDLEIYALNRRVLQDIAIDIAKPQRRSDSPLEYLPTQYIAELIKRSEYDGVEYKSTLHKGGYNIAVFTENAFECVSVKTCEITSTTYDKR